MRALSPPLNGNLSLEPLTRGVRRGRNKRLYYYAAGTRQADPIILIHGFPTCSHFWNYLVSRLPSGHPDPLGCGHSDLAEHDDFRSGTRKSGLLD